MNVFLDLDGTLTDPREGIVGCLTSALASVSRDASRAGELTRFIGPPLAEVMAELLNTNDPNLIAEGVTAYRRCYNAKGYLQNEPYEGIHQVLEQLASRFQKLLIVTSKPTAIAQQIANHFELTPYLYGIYGSGKTGELADKRVLIRHVLDGEALSSSQVVMVGDRKHDVIGAAHNQVASVGALWGYGSRSELSAAGAHALCSAPSALPQCLGDMRNG